jgi:hypothetical protein
MSSAALVVEYPGGTAGPESVAIVLFKSFVVNPLPGSLIFQPSMLPVEQTQKIPFASLPFLFGLEKVKTPCSPGINFIWEVPGAFTMFKDFIVPSHTAIFNFNKF